MRAHSVLGMWAAVVLLVGCGGGGGGSETTERPPQGSRKAWITLDGHMGPTNVGILMAQERGYFTDLGIEVTITGPETPSRPVIYVANRSVEFGVSHQPQVVVSREKGVPIVAVGSVIARPTAAMIWLQRSGIRGIADLEGKTIAIPGIPFQEQFLQRILARAGLTLRDVEVKHVWYDLAPALVNGRADAIFGGSWNLEGARLTARGLKPVITRVQSLGVPAYDELVLIARSDLAAEDPQLVRDVMTAVVRGTAAAVEHPEAVVNLIMKSGERDAYLTRKRAEAEVEATLPLLSETGYMDPLRASGLVEWMDEEGLIQRRLPNSAFLTNDYLGLRP
jgi:ABC-type nitrate/sulfonate/bicarbonate transport system substrate-binding protein